MAEALPSMDVVREVEFVDGLSRLQGWLGARVGVEINQHGTFFGCALNGELRRVTSLEPDRLAIHIGIGKDQGLSLDPAATRTYYVVGPDGDAVEFRLANGISVLIEHLGDVAQVS